VQHTWGSLLMEMVPVLRKPGQCRQSADSDPVSPDSLLQSESEVDGVSLTGLDFTRRDRPMFTRRDRPMFTRHDRPMFTRHDRPMYTTHGRLMFTTMAYSLQSILERVKTWSVST